VRMLEIVATQCNHFSVASNRSLFILVAVISEETFHQPSFSVLRIYLYYSIEENFSNFPSFF